MIPTKSYTFLFSPATSERTYVQFFDCSDRRKHSAYTTIDDYQFMTNSDVLLPSILADLVDISVAVHFVDRTIKRSTDISYSFELAMPVRNPDFFSSNEVRNLLKETLFWFTEDFWTFQFSVRPSEYCRHSEIQPRLFGSFSPLGETEVALWSGGLDSLAGLYNRVKQNPSRKYVLVGTGSNNQNLRVQKNVAELVKRKFNSSIEVVQVPYQIEVPEVEPKSRNRYQRSRGFTFMVIGAVTAYLKGQRALNIYENGVGAINLPYSEAEIGLDHTRSVNPVSLIMMSRLISTAIQEPFHIYNPYIFWTKAEMCKVLVEEGETELIKSTKSCDSQQRNKECGVIQCGFCSSCVLRRLALEYWGISDPTEYLPSEFEETPEDNFVRAMIYQSNRIQAALMGENVWYLLSRNFIDLERVVDYLSLSNEHSRSYYEQQIIRLYSKYCEEWATILHRGTNFLKKVNRVDVVV